MQFVVFKYCEYLHMCVSVSGCGHPSALDVLASIGLWVELGVRHIKFTSTLDPVPDLISLSDPALASSFPIVYCRLMHYGTEINRARLGRARRRGFRYWPFHTLLVEYPRDFHHELHNERILLRLSRISVIRLICNSL
jgi:hypothetical protein